MTLEHYEPENLKLWTMPDHYAGEVWPGYYVFLGQHRDSDILTQSNFACGLKAIGGENGDTVTVVREGHWAVGWIEWIAIHQDDGKALKIADEIAGALEDYPIVDESDFSEREFEAVHEYWAGWRGDPDNPDISHRISEIKRWNEQHAGPQWASARVPILAARHSLFVLSERYPDFEQWINEIGRE